jgi:Zn-dependent alcohol dehydrogenase
MRNRLRAIRLVRHGAPLVAEDIADPIPRSGEVLVEIRAAGICHSDATYRADAARTTIPRTLGHEVAGVIAGTNQRVAITCCRTAT